MLSVKALGGVFEIWLFAPGDYREAVAECGLLRTQGEADHMAACLRYWLRFNVFGAGLTDAVPSALDRAQLRELPDYLRGRGIDPAGVRVVGVRRGRESDNHVTDEGDADDLDDTDTLDPRELVKWEAQEC